MSWRMQFLAPPPSGPAYVRGGLVFWLDGIDNAGKGAHDPNASVWKDLTGNGYDFIRNGGVVTSDSMDFSDRSGYAICTGSDPLPSDEYTIELVVERKFAANQDFLFGSREICAVSYKGTLIPRTTATIASGKETFTSDIGVVGNRYSLSFTGGRKNTYTRDGVSVAPNGTSDEMNSRLWNAGEVYVSGASFTGHRSSFTFSSVRIYSRALSPDEIRQNYEVDKERFHL